MGLKDDKESGGRREPSEGECQRYFGEVSAQGLSKVLGKPADWLQAWEAHVRSQRNDF